MPRDLSPIELQAEAATFRDQFKTVLLATSSKNGFPDVSYSPCVLSDNGNVCIFVSELARHTHHLLTNPVASLMFIADESTSRNQFARKRLTLRAEVSELDRETTEGARVMKNFSTRFGKTMQVLKMLPDFHLLHLKILTGNYVRGFGQSYVVEGSALKIKHLQKGGGKP